MGKLEATEEQKVYANILDKGMKLGLVTVIVTFVIYLTGVLPPNVANTELTQYWNLPVSEYLEKADVETGWAWLGMLNKGDFLNFIGIAILAGVSIICYLAIIPILLRKKDTAYVVLAILEVLVLTLAASGVLKSGH